jgi:hypothetical protein
MITRNGKIARLPRNIREQLNHKLDDGEPGGRIVEWLNGLPEVRHVLAEDFGGCRINEQNLSQWRGGGYRDWQKQQERRTLVRQLTEDAGELKTDAGGVELGNHLSAVLMAELAESARDLLAAITDPAERSARAQEFLHTLARVRREDYRAGRLEIERERRARERAEEKEKDDHRREWAREVAPVLRSFKRSDMVNYYAQPDFTSQAMATGHAESLLRDMEPDQTVLAGSVTPDQTQSN